MTVVFDVGGQRISRNLLIYCVTIDFCETEVRILGEKDTEGTPK